VGGSGNVFVADGHNNRVVKFDPFGRQLAIFTGFQLPTGVAVDRAGNLYVADLNALEVTKLSSSGHVLARWHVPWANGTGSGLPEAVAVDSRGNVYVGAHCYQDECPPPHGIQQEVIKLNAHGAFQSSLLGNNPYVPIGPGEQRFVTVDSVAVDAKDNLYVGSSAIRNASGNFSSGILVYTPGLSLQTIYPLPGNGAPTGLAFDGSNALYVAQGSQVIKYVS
jgi:sugar lactone lactonase YvrE